MHLPKMSNDDIYFMAWENLRNIVREEHFLEITKEFTKQKGDDFHFIKMYFYQLALTMVPSNWNEKYDAGLIVYGHDEPNFCVPTFYALFDRNKYDVDQVDDLMKKLSLDNKLVDKSIKDCHYFSRNHRMVLTIKA